MSDLTHLSEHFAFGDNWARYAALLDEGRVAQATADLRRLVGDLTGRSFVDIGCGSGVHALAALRLGASSVLALDLDPASVATTRQTLQRFAPQHQWDVRQCSVFELDPRQDGEFDVVYSWGVLHHTGDLQRALQCASALVRPDGRFAVALYRRTLMCPLWRIEKRWYSHAGPRAQRMAQRLYVSAFGLALALRGQSLKEYAATYSKSRGMNFSHDVHDWLGGFPYESILHAELEHTLGRLGLQLERVFAEPRRRGRPLGLFGSGCDEYLFRRPARGNGRIG